MNTYDDRERYKELADFARYIIYLDKPEGAKHRQTITLSKIIHMAHEALGRTVYSPAKEVDPDPIMILRVPMIDGNDAGADNVGGYLIKLLSTLWKQEQNFSGKRPFGNSGWKCEIEESLVRAGYVEGSFDENGYLEHVDSVAVNRMISSAITALGDYYSTTR